MRLPYYLLQLKTEYFPISGKIYYYDTNLDRVTFVTSPALFYYSILEYEFPVYPTTFDFPYLVSAKLRITAVNTNYRSALLRINTAAEIRATIKIQTDNKVQAELKIKTTGPAQVKLNIITFRATPRPQVMIRTIANNTNYASALLKTETTYHQPIRAKLSIKTRTYNKRIAMPEYYAFYNIVPHGFLS